jgi:hypothetical protein
MQKKKKKHRHNYITTKHLILKTLGTPWAGSILNLAYRHRVELILFDIHPHLLPLPLVRSVTSEQSYSRLKLPFSAERYISQLVLFLVR